MSQQKRPMRKPDAAIYDNEVGYSKALFDAWFDEVFEDPKMFGLNSRQVKELIKFYEKQTGKKAEQL